MTTPTEDLEPNELDLEQQFGQGAPRDLLGVQYGAADSADFSEGTWSFKMHGAWQVAAGEFVIMPRAAYAALQAIAEPHTVSTDWQPINTLDKAEDEVWLLKGGNVIDGPRHPEIDDADLYTHWASCRPPKLLKAAPIWDGKGLPPIGCDVLIRHGRDDADHVCTVTGYEVWPSLDKDPFNSRVQVHLVYKGTDTKNCRALCDLWPVGADTGERRAHSAPQQAAAKQGEAADVRRYVILQKQGEVPRRVGPCPDKKSVESKLREAYTAYPDCICIVIDLPSDSYPEHGREWLDIYGDKRKPRIAAQAAPTGPTVTQQQALARFGHHPDPAVDFCVEVDTIEAEVVDRAAGLPPQFDLAERTAKAMEFAVGGDAGAVVAKQALRLIDASLRAARPLAPQDAAPVGVQEQRDAMEAHAKNTVAWAVAQWHEQVAKRPLVNVHRHTMDGVWRQVIRQHGGDPEKLIGPAHDELLAARAKE